MGADNTPAPVSAGPLMVVEDDPGLRDLLLRILTTAGYQVVSAPGAREALELVAQGCGPVALLVSDLSLPVMDGATLASHMHRLSPGMRTLLISGHPHQDADAGTVAFLQKPFTARTLTQKVAAVLHAA